MKHILVLFMLVSLFSCSKETYTPTENVEKNSADLYVEKNPESITMTPGQIDEFLNNCDLWDRATIEKMVSTPQDTNRKEVMRRYNLLMSKISSRANNEPRVETIIQQTTKKRIIDANASVVAYTVASLGSSTNGQYLSVDFYRTPANTINSTDVYLAGWAYNTTFQNGTQFAAFDNFIEFQDTEPTYVTEYSGGNFGIEAALVYNGPTTAFTFYNVLTSQVETVTIETGELMVYGPFSEYGELFFNLTLADEIYGSPTYNTATIQGPIPGTSSGAGPAVALTGGPWPVVQ